MNKEIISEIFFKHLADTELIGYSDFDEIIDNYRICVDFRVNGDLYIDAIEVLNDEWDVLPLESKELENCLIPLFNEWIKQQKEYKSQQKEILNDQKI